MTEHLDRWTQIFGGIIAGEFDGELDKMSELIINRRRELNSQKKSSMCIGEIVTFSKTCRPIYIRGGKAEIVGFKQKNLDVKITELPSAPANSRFYVGQIITCPPDLLDVVDVGAAVEKIKDKYTP